MLHKLIPSGEVHVPYNWVFANSVARENATGIVDEDVGKLARQLDNETLWILVSSNPVTWKPLGGNEGVAKYTIPGTVSAHIGGIRWYPESNCTLEKVYVSVSYYASSGLTTIQLRKNGTPLPFTITLPPNQYKSSPVFTNISLTTEDYLTVDVLEVGTGIKHMIVYVTYQKG